MSFYRKRTDYSGSNDLTVEGEAKVVEISFVIPTLNEELLLPGLLTSIKNQVSVPGALIKEIIVVDSGSSDKTVDVAKAFGCKVVETTPGNVSRSRNVGARYATGALIAFVDADCELSEQWLPIVVKHLNEDKVVAAGTAIVTNVKNSTWVEKTWYELVHKNNNPEPDKVYKNVEWLSTSNLVVKADAFRGIGGFNEELTTCEDVEIGYRMARVGVIKKIEFGCVTHHGESKKVSDFFRREAWRSRGSIGLLKKEWMNPRELFGFLLPFIIIGAVATSVFCHINILVLFHLERLDMDWTHVFPLLLGPFLLAYIIVKRKVKLSLVAPAAILLCVYFSARCFGSLLAFKRVDR